MEQFGAKVNSSSHGRVMRQSRSSTPLENFYEIHCRDKYPRFSAITLPSLCLYPNVFFETRLSATIILAKSENIHPALSQHSFSLLLSLAVFSINILRHQYHYELLKIQVWRIKPHLGHKKALYPAV